MSKHLDEAKAYLAELRKKRSSYPQGTPARISRKYRTESVKPEIDFFKESSFLYSRSYHEDIGNRPFSGIKHWTSPDLNISPITNIGSYTTQLEGGKTYNISCRLHNRGDLMVPYPKVEFFLTDPALGFNVNAGKYLGVTQLPALLLPGSTDVCNFQYKVPAAESGHKCLFSRTYSFSPLDKPYDLVNLDPRLDRHIAQQNLNFVPQATPYFFNLNHQPNTFETIAFLPLTRDAVFALQHPALLNFKVRSLKSTKRLRKIRVKQFDATEHKVELKRRKNTWSVSSNGKGMDVKTQQRLFRQTEAIVRNVYNNETNFSNHKEELREVRKMHKSTVTTRFAIEIPDFGLPKGEVVGFEIVNINQLTNQIKGGITIIAI